jgi:acyl carrier protein
MRRWWCGGAAMKHATEQDDLTAIAKLIAIELNVEEDSVREAHSLRRELRMDSIAAANILFSIEDAFDISFENVDIKNVDTVDDIVALVKRLQAGKRA